MAPAIVDGIARRRKTGIGECSNRDSDTARFAVLGVEEVCATDRAKAKSKLGTLIAGADVLGDLAEDLVGGGKPCKCREDGTCSLLTGEAMANADNARLALNFDAKLPTVARSGSG
jgi:hypothetical protein